MERHAELVGCIKDLIEELRSLPANMKTSFQEVVATKLVATQAELAAEVRTELCTQLSAFQEAVSVETTSRVRAVLEQTLGDLTTLPRARPERDAAVWHRAEHRERQLWLQAHGRHVAYEPVNYEADGPVSASDFLAAKLDRGDLYVLDYIKTKFTRLLEESCVDRYEIFGRRFWVVRDHSEYAVAYTEADLEMMNAAWNSAQMKEYVCFQLVSHRPIESPLRPPAASKLEAAGADQAFADVPVHSDF